MNDHDELLDHELHRIPCSKRMKEQVTQAARAAHVPVAQWQREAIRQRLEREQGK